MASILNATTTSGLVTSADNSGSLQLQTNNGTTAVTIDNSQRVGVNTTSPTAPLDIQADSGSGAINIRGRVSGDIGSLNFYNNANTTQQFFIQSRAAYTQLNTVANIDMLLATNNTERMRITSGGFVKASNDGTYVSSTGPYHEFRTNDNNPSVFVTATNASFGSNAQIIDITRAATSGYNFGLFRSSAGGDSEFVFRGDGNGYADGTWNNNGADYAEYFESATGQAIPVGSTVVLENNKVRLATQSDNPSDVIGVVRPKEPSKASMVVGNTAWNKWANKYLTDDFDRYIMEDHDVVEWTDADGKQHSYESHNIPADVVVPADAVRKTHDDKGIKFQHYKLNPVWNPDAEYINRENRDEWLIIGLIGQVKVFKGQTMGDRWKKMRDVSDSVEEWFIR